MGNQLVHVFLGNVGHRDRLFLNIFGLSWDIIVVSTPWLNTNATSISLEKMVVPRQIIIFRWVYLRFHRTLILLELLHKGTVDVHSAAG